MMEAQYRNSYRVQRLNRQRMGIRMTPGTRRVRKRRKLRLGARLLIVTLMLLGAVLFFRNLFADPVIPVVAVFEQPFEIYESSIIDILPYRDRYHIIVWLDAGLGGFDIGTYVMRGDMRIYEKDITLDIVLRIYELFQQSNSGVRVFLTRADDSHVSLSSRTNLWNDTEYMVAKADLVVSVHVDYYEGSTAQAVSGVQVNYYRNQLGNTGRVDITNAQFAQILQDQLVNETGARDRQIRGDRGFTILEGSTMPAVLIETGFMSNSEELARLLTEEYRMLIARAIYNGIVEAFGFPRLE